MTDELQRLGYLALKAEQYAQFPCISRMSDDWHQIALVIADAYNKLTTAQDIIDGMREEGCAAVGLLENIFNGLTSDKILEHPILTEMTEAIADVLVSAKRCDHFAENKQLLEALTKLDNLFDFNEPVGSKDFGFKYDMLVNSVFSFAHTVLSEHDNYKNVVHGTTVQSMTFQEAIESIMAEIIQVVVARHRKYGPDNIAITGLDGIAIRIMDKGARLRNLSCNTDILDESIEDILIDLAGYGIIGLMYQRGWLGSTVGW